MVAAAGQRLEAMSYPFPENEGLWIMAREPGDPMTVTEYRLLGELVDFLELDSVAMGAPHVAYQKVPDD